MNDPTREEKCGDCPLTNQIMLKLFVLTIAVLMQSANQTIPILLGNVLKVIDGIEKPFILNTEKAGSEWVAQMFQQINAAPADADMLVGRRYRLNLAVFSAVNRASFTKHYEASICSSCS